MFKKLLSILVLVGFVFVKSASAQITIAPIMLFLDDQNRFGSILVLNGSDQVQEVTIEFPFGYPITDEEGNINMVYSDSTMGERYGISDVVRGFPKSFSLQPGQRQVVRLTVRPKDFQDGMYWSRIRTTSTPQAPPVGETSDDAITTQITYKFEQVTTVFYKNGDVDTGLEIGNLTTKQTDQSVEFIADVTRTGNSPFLGSIILTVKDEQGNIVSEKRTSTSIYFDYRQIFEISKDQLPNGSYTAEFEFISERNDVARSDIIQIDPIKQSINFTVK